MNELPERVIEDGLHPYTEGIQVDPRFNPRLDPRLETASNTNENGIVQPSQRIGVICPIIFWLMIGVIAIIVIAASVAGAVGGSRSSSKQSPPESVTSSFQVRGVKE